MAAKGVTWAEGKGIWSKAEIERMACAFLHCDVTKVDYEAAAKDYGSASANSFRVMLNSGMNKVSRKPGHDCKSKPANGNQQQLGTPPPTPGKRNQTAGEGAPAKRSRKNEDVAQSNGYDDAEMPVKKEEIVEELAEDVSDDLKDEDLIA